jgi:hypothetical protein
MSGKHSSSASRLPSGSSGPNGSSSRAAWSVAKLLLRAAVLYGVITLCWLPLQESYIEFLAGVAERVFRLVDTPPLITELRSLGNRIAYFSFITGSEEPLGIWSGANLHFYLVTALALVLSVPLNSGVQRFRLVSLTAILFVVLSLAICIVNIKTNADRSAMQLHGIVLYGDAERAVLEWTNRTLLMVSMLAFPAYLFFLSYLRTWVNPGTAANASPRDQRRGRRRLIRKRVVAVLLFGLLALVVVSSLWTRTAPVNDRQADHEGWMEIMELNPGFAPAKVNVGLWHQQQGRVDAAITLYRAALSIDSSLLLAHFNLGNALRSQAHRNEAIEHYEYALRLDPEHAATHWNLGLTWFELQRPCRALDHYERSAELRPAYMNQAAFREDLRTLRNDCVTPE